MRNEFVGPISDACCGTGDMACSRFGLLERKCGANLIGPGCVEDGGGCVTARSVARLSEARREGGY
jgi:hypothetical protein